MLPAAVNTKLIKNIFESRLFSYSFSNFYFKEWSFKYYLSFLFAKQSNEIVVNDLDVESFEELKREDIFTINAIVDESSLQIATIIGRCNTVYCDVVESIGLRDVLQITESKLALDNLNDTLNLLRDNVYYFIKSLDETSVEASKFYILILGHLQDLVQATSFITENSHFHVCQKQQQLKFNQIRDLKGIELQVQGLFAKIEVAFVTRNFEKIDSILMEKGMVLENISALIQKQAVRTRTLDTGSKNSKLYFSLLLKTNDLVQSSMSLLVLFKAFQMRAKKSA